MPATCENQPAGATAGCARRPLDVLVVGNLIPFLGLGEIPGPVVADLKYLTRKHIGLPLSLARVSLPKVVSEFESKKRSVGSWNRR